MSQALLRVSWGALALLSCSCAPPVAATEPRAATAPVAAASVATPVASSHGEAAPTVEERKAQVEVAPQVPVDDMVKIPGGRFRMGTKDTYENERPIHTVKLAAFELDRTEVSVGAYRACVAAGACSEEVKTPYHDGKAQEGEALCNYGAAGREAHPINCVDWSQASAYCAWVKKRLPSEEEWEYAARGTDGREFPWGNEDVGDRACWGRGEAGTGTCAVGNVRGASPFGALDMAGNVWEWTSSGYSDDYTDRRSERTRVVRGGGWSNDMVSYLRAASRGFDAPDDRFTGLGFRCAR